MQCEDPDSTNRCRPSTTISFESGYSVDLSLFARGFRALNAVDDFTRECVALEVNRSLPGLRAVRVLDRLAETVGLPEVIVMDNGAEFSGRALDLGVHAWLHLRFVRPGKAIENAFLESFNGKFRDECLNEHWLPASRKRSSGSKLGGSTTTLCVRIVRRAVFLRPGSPLAHDAGPTFYRVIRIGSRFERVRRAPAARGRSNGFMHRRG